MGKVLVCGHAEREVAPDFCEVNFCIETKGATAAKAAAAAMTELEKLVSSLTNIGFKPEEMFISNDRSSGGSRYDNVRDYTSTKAFRLRFPVNVPVVNRINDIIASGFENTTLSVEYYLSSRSAIVDELKKEAIRDSRRKAEILAAATGTLVMGIKAANFEDDDMEMDIADLNLSLDYDDDPSMYLGHRLIEPSGDFPLSDKLVPDSIKLDADVRIVWTIE